MSGRTLRQIVTYPLKSAPGIDLPATDVAPEGLPGDRCWLLARPQGRIVVLRDRPDLVRLRPSLSPGNGLHLATDDGRPPLSVPIPGADAATVTVTIKGRTVPTRAAGLAADAWLTDLLDEPLRLLHVPPGTGTGSGPLLLTGTASLAALADHLGRPVAMARFRANLVVDTEIPWEEENWTTVRVGELVCDVQGACPRCPLITVDPITGAVDPTVLEGLADLRGTKQACFGVFLVPRGSGRVRVGDAVAPL